MSDIPDYYTYEKLREMRGDTLQQHVENSLRARAAKREKNTGGPNLIRRIAATVAALRTKRDRTPAWRKAPRIGE